MVFKKGGLVGVKLLGGMKGTVKTWGGENRGGVVMGQGENSVVWKKRVSLVMDSFALNYKQQGKNVVWKKRVSLVMDSFALNYKQQGENVVWKKRVSLVMDLFALNYKQQGKNVV